MSNLNKNLIPSLFDVVSEVGETVLCHPLTIVKEYIRQKPEGENIPYFKELITDKVASYVDKLYFNDEINGRHMYEYHFDLDSIGASILKIDEIVGLNYKGYRDSIEECYSDIPEKYKSIVDICFLNMKIPATQDWLDYVNKQKHELVNGTIELFEEYKNTENRLEVFYRYYVQEIFKDPVYKSRIKRDNYQLDSICKNISSRYKYIDYHFLMKCCLEHIEYENSGKGPDMIGALKLMDTYRKIYNKEEKCLSLILYESKIRESLNNDKINLSKSANDKIYKISATSLQSKHVSTFLQTTNPIITIEDEDGNERQINIEELFK